MKLDLPYKNKLKSYLAVHKDNPLKNTFMNGARVMWLILAKEQSEFSTEKVKEFLISYSDEKGRVASWEEIAKWQYEQVCALDHGKYKYIMELERELECRLRTIVNLKTRIKELENAPS